MHIMHIVMLLIAALAVWLACNPTNRARISAALQGATGGLCAHNEAIPVDSISRLTDAAITTEGLLYKKGSDADHIAVCGASDVPLGSVEDTPDAAEQRVAVQLLGKGGCKRMIASGAVAADVRVFTAASGKVSELSATPGTYYFVGVSLNAAADGEEVKVNDCAPVATVVT